MGRFTESERTNHHIGVPTTGRSFGVGRDETAVRTGSGVGPPDPQIRAGNRLVQHALTHDDALARAIRDAVTGHIAGFSDVEAVFQADGAMPDLDLPTPGGDAPAALDLAASALGAEAFAGGGGPGALPGGAPEAPTPEAPSAAALARRVHRRTSLEDEADPALHLATSQSGRPLPDAVRARFEQAMGHDFAHVRIHTSSTAQRAAESIHAMAFALGADVFFSAGRYAPGTPEGDRLLAHELTHVVQHDEGRLGGASGVSQPTDPAELEAYANEGRVVAELDAVDAAPEVVDAPSVDTPSMESPALEAPAPQGAPSAPVLRDPGDEEEEQPQVDTFEVVSAHEVRVNVEWYHQHFDGDGRGDQAMLEVLEALFQTERFAHGQDLSQADREEIVQHIGLRIPENAEGTSICRVDDSLLSWIGMPPGTPFTLTPARMPPPPHDPASPEPPPRYGLSLVCEKGEDLEGRQLSPELGASIVEGMNALVGGPMAQEYADVFVQHGLLHHPAEGARGFASTYPRHVLIEMYGEETWRAFETRQASETGEHTPSGPAGTEVDPSLTPEDLEFIERFLAELGQTGEGGPVSYIGPATLALMRRIDASEHKAQILERLRSGGDGDSGLSMMEAMQVALAAAETGAEMERLGIEPDEDSDTRRPFMHPVEGRILNHTDLLFTGKEAQFSFLTTSRGDFLGIPWVNVTWVITHSSPTEQGAVMDQRSVSVFTENHMGHTSHRDYAGEQPDRFEFTFDQPGIYEINAVVDHAFFLPAAFKTFVEVTTADERLAELEDAAMGGFENPACTGENDVIDGEVIAISRGDLDPADLAPLDLQQQISRVEAYAASTTDPAARRLAEDYLAELREARQTVTDELAEANTWSIAVQGTYLSRLPDARSQQLSIEGNAQQNADGQWRIRLHESTQVIDQRVNHFESDFHTSYEAAAIQAFTDLCNAFPSGLMSVRLEVLEDTGMSSGRWVGYQGDCNDTLEILQRTVFSPTAQIVVNVAAMVTMALFPMTAPVAMPLLIAYNAAATGVEGLDLGRRGNLTLETGSVLAGQVAMDLIPYVGRATKLVRVGGRAYRLVTALEHIGDAALIAEQAFQMAGDIRDAEVRRAAEIHAQLEQMRSDNPSDPRIATLEAQLREAEQRAQDRWEQVAVDLGGQQLLFRVGANMVGRLGTELAAARGSARDRIDGVDASTRVSESGVDADTLALDFDVPVRMVEGSDSVTIHFDSEGGGVSNLRVEVGANATMEMVRGHRDAVTRLQRWSGTIGEMRTLIDRVDAHFGGREHIPTDSAAFTARQELQKLAELEAGMLARLAGDAPDAAQIATHLEAVRHQMADHQRAIDDLSPGLGQVAARGPDDLAADGVRLGEDGEGNAVTRRSGERPHTPAGTGQGTETAKWQTAAGAEGWARYQEAVENGYNGQYRDDPQGFVDMYEDGFRLNGNQRWERPDGRPRRDPVRFEGANAPEDGTACLALLDETFGGFREWRNLVADLDIATHADQATMVEGIFPTRTDERTRTLFKAHYREAVLAHFTGSANREARAQQLQQAYPDLDWAGNADAAFRQAAHQDFLRHTQHLAPADKGNLFEPFERAVHRAPTQAEPHARLEVPDGSGGTTERVPDTLIPEGDGFRIQDSKNYSGRLSTHAVEQIDEFNGMIGSSVNRIGADGTTTPIPIRGVTVTMPDPRGVQANQAQLGTWLEQRHFQLEAFDWAGQRHQISTPRQLRRFLRDLGTPPDWANP